MALTDVRHPLRRGFRAASFIAGSQAGAAAETQQHAIEQALAAELEQLKLSKASYVSKAGTSPTWPQTGVRRRKAECRVHHVLSSSPFLAATAISNCQAAIQDHGEVYRQGFSQVLD